MNETKETTINDRLLAVFSQMMKESSIIPKTLAPIVENLVKGYLQKATPDQVRTIIIQLRDEFIPWLLSDD